MMCHKPTIFISVVAGLWSTPAQSFASPSALSTRVPPSVWTNRQHQQRIIRDVTKTQRRMLPLKSIPATIINNSLILLQNRALTRTIHFLLANTVYICRRSNIRNMSKRELLQIRLTRGDGVKLPLYVKNILAWQLFVNFVFPILELTARMFGYVSFYYFYPNAHGFGIIFEPLSAQSFTISKRAKSQIRCDWHRFSVNVGSVGRDGWRHPPSIERNWPHFDIPKKGWKHWPWRRQCEVVRHRKEK